MQYRPPALSAKIHFFFAFLALFLNIEFFYTSAIYPRTSRVVFFRSFWVPCHDVPVSPRLSSLNIGVLFVPDAIKSTFSFSTEGQTDDTTDWIVIYILSMLDSTFI
jgi:hypothetical protein